MAKRKESKNIATFVYFLLFDQLFKFAQCNISVASKTSLNTKYNRIVYM